MKNLLFVLGFVFIVTTVYCQDEWYPHGTTVSYHKQSFWPSDLGNGIEQMICNKDTVIDETQYKLLERRLIHLNPKTLLVDTLQLPNNYIYEEGEVVYSRSIFGENYVLYDFSKNVGDTIFSMNAVVKDTTHFILNGKKLKYQVLNFFCWDGEIGNNILGVMQYVGDEGQGAYPFWSENFPCNPPPSDGTNFSLKCIENEIFGSYNFFQSGTDCDYFPGFPTSSTEVIDEAIIAFPNPTFGDLSFNMSIIDLKIYNAFGQLIAEFSSVQEQNRIDISDFDRGIYLVKYSDESGQYHTNKIMKQ